MSSHYKDYDYKDIPRQARCFSWCRYNGLIYSKQRNLHQPFQTEEAPKRASPALSMAPAFKHPLFNPPSSTNQLFNPPSSTNLLFNPPSSSAYMPFSSPSSFKIENLINSSPCTASKLENLLSPVNKGPANKIESLLNPSSAAKLEQLLNPTPVHTSKIESLIRQTAPHCMSKIENLIHFSTQQHLNTATPNVQGYHGNSNHGNSHGNRARALDKPLYPTGGMTFSEIINAKTLVTSYREAANFLYRAATELEQLLPSNTVF